MSRPISAAVTLTLAMTLMPPLAPAAIPRIDALGDLPGGQVRSEAWGISADGRYVVGHSWTTGDNNAEAYVWDLKTGMQRLAPGPGGLNSSQAVDISADGMTIAGFRHVRSSAGSTGIVGQACLWKVGGNVVPLRAEGPGSVVRAISDDGKIAVGVASTSISFHGFRWTEATSMTTVSGNSLEVNGISGDGSTMIDRSNVDGEQAVIRKAGTPSIALGIGTRGLALSQDGTVAVGSKWTPDGTKAFRWTQQTGLQLFGTLSADAYDVSADGNTIVGFDTFSPNGGPHTAYVWTSDAGIRRLADILGDAGVDLSHWRVLQYATAVSADGSVIAGYGVNRFNQEEAFRAVIPEPAMAIMMCVVVALKRSR